MVETDVYISLTKTYDPIIVRFSSDFLKQTVYFLSWSKLDLFLICLVSYKTTIGLLKALRTEIEHRQLSLDKEGVQVQNQKLPQ